MLERNLIYAKHPQCRCARYGPLNRLNCNRVLGPNDQIEAKPTRKEETQLRTPAKLGHRGFRVWRILGATMLRVKALCLYC